MATRSSSTPRSTTRSAAPDSTTSTGTSAAPPEQPRPATPAQAERPDDGLAEYKTPASDRRRRKPTAGFKVQALSMLFYDNKRIRPGNVFMLSNGNHFDRRHMAKVDARTPERITTGQDELEQKRREARAGHGSRPDTAQTAVVDNAGQPDNAGGDVI